MAINMASNMAIIATCVAYSPYVYVAPSVSLKVIALNPPIIGLGASGTVQYAITTEGAWVIVRDRVFSNSTYRYILKQGIGAGVGTFPDYLLSTWGYGYTETIRVFVNPDPNPVSWDHDSWWFYGWVDVSVKVQPL